MRKLLLILVLLMAQRLWAQSLLRFQHLNVEDGLSQSSVNHILQDTHGFLWFATGDGLNRYDGKQFIKYRGKFNDTLSTSMKDRNINSKLIEDRYHKLWFSSDAGVSCMDTRTGKFRIVLDKNEAACAATLHGIDDDKLWLSIPHKGIFSMDVATYKTTRYPFTDKWHSGNDVNIISGGTISGKKLWIVDKQGLICFNMQTGKDERKLVKTGLTSVNRLKSGHLLLGSKNGIYQYNTINENTAFTTIRDTTGALELLWHAFAEDTITGAVYLGAVSGGLICKLNTTAGTHEFLRFQDSKINDLFIDKGHNLWVGTDGSGVYKLNIEQPIFFCFGPKAIYNATEQNNFIVKSIYKATDGPIWMGVYGKGIITYDPASGKQARVDVPVSCDDKLISTIIKDSSGNIVATVGNTILWINPVSQNVISKLTLPYAPLMPDETPSIFACTEWKKGHFLVGTNLGLYTVANTGNTCKSWSPKTFYYNKLLTWPYNFYKTNDGSIYLGMRSGFLKMRVASDSETINQDNGLPDMPVRHFYKSTHHPVLWIATEQGLIAYNEYTKHYTVFDERWGLANSFVYAILDQDDSTFWISTNNGISNVKASYGNAENISVKVTNFTVKDGLQSSEFNTGAYFKDTNGTLYFGGIAGINWFHPLRMKTTRLSLRPVISGIFVNDSLYAGDTAIYVKNLTLPYNRNTISLSFSALDFAGPGSSTFSCILDGFDNDWVTTTNDNIRYANLAPGNYEFQLRVSSSDGIWNEAPVTLSITILPPYWQTWWFRTIVAACILSIIYGTGRYYLRQKIKTRIKNLEQQQALYRERLRISKDVHDDLGSGLSKISLIAAIAEKKNWGNPRLTNDIKHISSVSKELIDNMRDLVWVLNPENTSLEQLVARLREYGADYLEHIPIHSKLQFPDSLPAKRITGEAQRNILLTVKEAINNSIKHADASQINISLVLQNNKMTITIADDGHGFEMKQLKAYGNGLRNMKQRIESLGGTFTIASVPNETTSIEISIHLEELTCPKKIPL